MLRMYGIFFLFTASAFSFTADRQFGNHEVYLDFSDAYYCSAGFYFSLTKSPIEHFSAERERDLYKYLLKRFFFPRILVIEGGAYPLPVAGAALRHYAYSAYNRMQYRNIHFVQSLTYSIDFPEPWTVSLFLGNVVKFTETGREVQGRGYTGLLLSYGNYHIKDNILIKDHWLEGETKLKGDKRIPAQRINWSYRLGGRLHMHPEIRDLVYFSFVRDRSDFVEQRFNIFKNTNFAFRGDFAFEPFSLIRLSAEVGKKYPAKIGRKKTILGFSFGIKMDINNPYLGTLGEDFSRYGVGFIFKPKFTF